MHYLLKNLSCDVTAVSAAARKVSASDHYSDSDTTSSPHKRKVEQDSAAKKCAKKTREWLVVHVPMRIEDRKVARREYIMNENAARESDQAGHFIFRGRTVQDYANSLTNMLVDGITGSPINEYMTFVTPTTHKRLVVVFEQIDYPIITSMMLVLNHVTLTGKARGFVKSSLMS
jgi:hypothetical protein